jgi:hypothetical protein
MPEVIIQLIIVMLICGFAYWIWTLARPFLPIAGPFAQIVDVLVIILIGAIVLFYAIIPLLRMLPRLLH